MNPPRMEHLPENMSRLTSELVQPSRQFEPFVPSRNRSLTERLSILNDLEGITHQSLPAQTQSVPTNTLAASMPEVIADPIPAAPVKPEYRPALQDPALLTALLKMHHQASQAQPAPRAPQDPAATPREQTSQGSLPNTASSFPLREEPAFVPAEQAYPKVDVTPKVPPLSQKRSLARTSTLLRPT